MSHEHKYTVPAIALHWVMALLIIGLWISGTVIDELPKGPLRITAISWHKWVGVTGMFLWALRITWRATHATPPLEKPMAPWLTTVMKLTHFALYALMIVVPVLGWLTSSAKGYTVNYFGLFELPDLVNQDKSLGHLLKELHESAAHAMMVLIGLHVAAAIKHQVIDKDNLMKRMSFK